MTITLINIAGKISSETVEVLGTVSRLANELGSPFVVVGASARDLVLHYGYGAPVKRATYDVDFAVEVATWEVYGTLRERLEQVDYTATEHAHRMHSPNGTVIDIVPFGPIESDGGTIGWPPDGEVVMDVTGFQDACDAADWVRVQEEPEPLDIPVASPAGMAVLKLIAWTDREVNLRGKDATDLAYLLRTYETIPEVRDTLYGEESKIMEACEWDLSIAASHLLGRHAAEISGGQTRAHVLSLRRGELGSRSPERLTQEMCEQVDVQFERNHQLLTAFLTGFEEP